MPDDRASTSHVETILVVDDDPQIRRLLERLLSADGFFCEAAATVEEARRALAATHVDLVLLDLQMPGDSGLSLARELAGRPKSPTVVMISGQDDASVASIALDTGAFGYVTKPFKRNEVRIAIDHALRHRRHEIDARGHRARLEDRIVETTAAAQQAVARLRLANEEIVLRLSRAVEYRDPETGLHVERMSHYCGLLAGRLGLVADDVRVASRLHDVGKIAVRDSILLTPGPLTVEARREMERHAEIGHRLLRGSRSELLDQAAIIAWTHHERFDGTGYPRGLAGEDIPLAGRIAAVADVFDALTTDRVYRAAMSPDDAFEHLRAESGRHFDPAVVDVFLEEADAVASTLARWGPDPRSRPVPQHGQAAAETVVALQQAAETLGVSPSRLRRWADEGRIHAIRTVGGHRRFPIDAVQRLAAELGARPSIRPVSPPTGPLPALADRLRTQGIELVAVATGSLYRGGPTGWFAGDGAAAPVRTWLGELIRASEAAQHGGVLEATATLMDIARVNATGLLERHSFLERFSQAVTAAMSQAGAPQAEVVATRHLFAAMTQSLLEGCP